MSEPSSFHDLVRRIRAGDHEAAAELVRYHEPAVRRAVRFRLVDTRLGAVIDSMDICQSVFASFFVRAAAGQYELDQPEDLIKLLVTMARNKLSSQARKQRAARRDNRRVVPLDLDVQGVAEQASSPSKQLAARELWQEVQRRLTPDERQLVELRSQGREWADIAAELGGNPVALRKKLSRTLNRIALELGLDESSHE